jgi:hypothetical protein
MVTEDEGSQSSPTQRGEWAANTLMSMMIPIAWYTSNYHPFVIDTGRGCDERGYLNDKMMSDDTEQKTWACHGRYLYYLVAPAVSILAPRRKH